MKTLERSFDLPCSASTFWNAYLDRDFARALYLDTLKYRGLEVLEATDSTRKLRVVPKLSLPRPIQKLIGDSFAYEDHGSLDREKNLWTWRMVQPSKLPSGAEPKPGAVTTRGTVRIEPTGEHTCRRHDVLVIEAHVFGVGKLIESSAEKEARAGWELEQPMLRAWVAKLEGAGA